jgi:hypothetical protein
MPLYQPLADIYQEAAQTTQQLLDPVWPTGPHRLSLAHQLIGFALFGTIVLLNFVHDLKCDRVHDSTPYVVFRVKHPSLPSPV